MRGLSAEVAPERRVDVAPEGRVDVAPEGRIDVAPVDVLLLRLDPELEPPSYARPGDAGADLRARTEVRLEPGERALIPTGVALALPEGYAGFVHPRSGLAAKHGLTIVNAPGTVDAGYRGEIKVCLLNTDQRTPITLHRGDLIAQLVVQQVVRADFVAVEQLPASDRGAAGHGSTGGVRAWSADVAGDQPDDRLDETREKDQP